MRLKNVLWVIIMTVLVGALIFVIGFRQELFDDVILGGSDGVFVDSGSLKDPLADYSQRVDVQEDNGGYSGSGNRYNNLIFPNIQITDWNFIVISGRSEKKDYSPEVAVMSEGNVRLDARITGNFMQLIAAAHRAGFDPHIACSYVSYTSQQQMINEKAALIAEEKGIDFAAARALALQYVEEPGRSEHQTGLAFDIYDKAYDDPDYSQMDPEFFRWMDENCAKYGFIKRYPENKEKITGRVEPWHYRYVGIAAAEFIMQNDLCLEEFIEHYEYQK